MRNLESGAMLVRPEIPWSLSYLDPGLVQENNLSRNKEIDKRFAPLERNITSLENSSKKISNLVDGLVASGNYDVLSDPNFRTKLDEFIGSHDRRSQDKLRAAAVTGWIAEVYDVTQTIAEKEERVDEKTYAEVFGIFKRMADFKGGKSTYESFSGIEKSSLFGETGLLRLRTTDIYQDTANGKKLITGKERRKMMRRNPHIGRDPSNSIHQQARLAILTMRGLNGRQIDRLFDYLQTERISRSKMGMLPSAMGTTLLNNQDLLSKSEMESLNRKRLLVWGNPPGPSEPRIGSWYERRTKVKFAKECIKNGWEISQEDFKHFSKSTQYRLKKMMVERKLGWNATLRRDKEGILYDSKWNRVEDPVKKPEPVVALIKKEETKPNIIFETMLRFAPSLGMALLAWHKSSKL